MNKSQTNALGDVAESLQTFDLIDLEQYTREKKYSANASKEFHLFYVGRDDVHDVLKHVLSRVSTSLYLNMFGFDDDELNDILMAKAKDPHVLTQSIFTDPDTISRFQSELIAEHMAAPSASDRERYGNRTKKKVWLNPLSTPWHIQMPGAEWRLEAFLL